jgi:hypothetical protein
MLVERCRARGISVYRFNTEDFPINIGLVVDPLRPEHVALIDKRGERIHIGMARGIWLRRPAWPVISSTITREADRVLATQESIAAMGGVWRLLARKCVSAADALSDARWRLPQLNLARQLGLDVPDSLVTTSTAVAREYVLGGPTVLKSVQDLAVEDGDESLIGFVDHVSEADLTDCELAPVFLQRMVEKVADWRITVVGDVVFGARIEGHSGGPVDVRQNSSTTATRSADVPVRIADGCRTFLTRMGLRFGAFDFGEDRDGRFWFFECNANGQWGWIELATGMPITDAIVSELISCSR